MNLCEERLFSCLSVLVEALCSDGNLNTCFNQCKHLCLTAQSILAVIIGVEVGKNLESRIMSWKDSYVFRLVIYNLPRRILRLGIVRRLVFIPSP